MHTTETTTDPADLLSAAEFDLADASDQFVATRAERGASVAAVARHLNVTPAVAADTLNTLVTLGRAERVGSGAWTAYRAL